MKKRRKKRGPAKDKKTRIPKKYLSGTKGSRRSELASLIKRISKLYKEGKTVPRSLIKRRVELGKKKKRARKKS
tara:strand:+ start:680 stop:901 length:222 start_codon:yes stop_codon:yes gene_type:complete